MLYILSTFTGDLELILNLPGTWCSRLGQVANDCWGLPLLALLPSPFGRHAACPTSSLHYTGLSPKLRPWLKFRHFVYLYWIIPEGCQQEQPDTQSESWTCLATTMLKFHISVHFSWGDLWLQTCKAQDCFSALNSLACPIAMFDDLVGLDVQDPCGIQ